MSLTEKKNTQSCRDPIHDMVDGGKSCIWCSAYHDWKMPNALSWPKLQYRAQNAPSTQSQPFSPPSITSLSARNGVFGSPSTVPLAELVRAFSTSLPSICSRTVNGRDSPCEAQRRGGKGGTRKTGPAFCFCGDVNLNRTQHR